MNYLVLAAALTLSIYTNASPSDQASNEMPYQDEKIGCSADAEAQRYIKDFNIDVSSFGGRELCNPKIDTKKLLNDIAILEHGQFVGNAPNNLIKGFVDANNYYGWMKQQTRGVERGNDIPYATAYNAGGYFTMQDGWAKLSTLGRVGTFVHEARHTEGYRHIRCNQGTYQGSSLAACDSNYSYGGSHAVEMEYYARVSVQGANFHPVYKKMARLMAMARSNFLFNTSPMQAREGVLALTADRKQAHLFDQGTWYNREVPSVDGRLKRTSFGGVLFDGLVAFAIELYENSGSADLVPDTYSYFKLLMENKSNVKDFEEFNIGTKRYVVQITNNDKLKSYDFPNGSWGSEQNLPFQVAKISTSVPGVARQGLFIINNKNEIYSYEPESQRLVSQTGAWDPTYKEVISFKGQNLILKDNGQIYVQTASSLQPWETKNKYSGLVSVPLYDAFAVVKE